MPNDSDSSSSAVNAETEAETEAETAAQTADTLAALADERRMLALLLQHTGQGFWFIDNALRTTDANPALCRMLRTTRQAMLGRSIYEFADEANQAIFHDQVGRRTRGEGSSYQIMLTRSDGSLLHCLNNATPVFNAAGQKMGAVGMFSDIGALKMAETALIAARDEAERANRAKSDFLSRMSHELRTPLNAVLGFGQLLESDPRDPLTPGQLTRVKELLRGGRHLLSLINEVLDLARIEAGALQVQLAPVEVAALVQDCLRLVTPMALEGGIALLAANGLQQALWAQADATRLKQVLLNLLSNAIKYNRAQGQVEVSWHAEPATATVRLDVRDTGHGLDAAQQALLFKAFERLQAEHSNVEGTGIGLSLSKSLVKLMHGQIGVHSVPGLGSTFWVRLNAARGLI